MGIGPTADRSIWQACLAVTAIGGSFAAVGDLPSVQKAVGLTETAYGTAVVVEG